MIIAKANQIVTDPCYVFPEAAWTDLCDRFFCKGEDDSNMPTSGVIYVNTDGTFSETGSEGSVAIPWSNTKFGDGEYQVREYGSSVLGKFCVDAGLFAIFPYDTAAKLRSVDEIEKMLERGLAAMANFGGVVEISDGDCTVGNVSIITSGTNEEDDEDDEWYNEDDEEEDDEDEEDVLDEVTDSILRIVEDEE